MPTVALPEIALIRLDATHLDAAQRLSAQESWPHRREEWAFLLAMGPGFGILAGDRLVGTAVLTPYGTDAATCNMIIVDDTMRGHGLGRKLMEALVAEAGDRECRLVATESGQPLYAKLGFVPTGRIRQFQGMAIGLPAPDGPVLARGDDLPEICALDRDATGMDRSVLLGRLMAEGPVFVLRAGSGLRGFVACRAFGRGDLMGPLAARDDDAADLLMRAAIARHAGRFLRVDLSAAGARHADLVQAAGLLPVGGGVAMTRPGATRCPAPSGAETYTLASQALC
ncbi:Acetyltransferase (GNAT) domain-containing protein [Gemmobacter megaterium]|uniref:Acetyltransferase (GNAT) domain-containing protein n=1 Tax=Gemmobacter megaterium TaxID=1086013 RepID=A0A1N7NF99_9RHOB|nr:GNAT family N-acetyltransferase [Gemmobacter megaterium]GGE14737.1 N-acetyltransferase [Gemmobacter megaterium]SIS96941.1 Acetyltransferase (GNAT) domain-containing protein [Gemmobacter megaterium]